MKRKQRGTVSYVFDDVIGLHCVRWMDNSIVTTISNCTGPYPLDKVERYSRKESKKFQVARPRLLRIYNQAMGGVDLLDSAVATTDLAFKERNGGGHILLIPWVFL